MMVLIRIWSLYFFNQKTAYEMRISDWSSDVCSSDLLLTAQGAKVTILDLNADLGESLASELGGLFVRTDVTDEASVEAGIAAAEAKHGPTRVLVNCAGTGAPSNTVSKGKRQSIDLFLKNTQLNLIGPFHVLSTVAAQDGST